MEQICKPVTFSAEAFRVWIASNDECGNPRDNMIPDEVAHDDYEFNPSRMVEDLLGELGRGTYPQVWRNAPDVRDADIWRTADSDGPDHGGIPTVEMSSGVTLAGRHLEARDLLYGFDGDKSLGGVDVAVLALEGVAGSINDAVAKYRATLGSAVGRTVWVLEWDRGTEGDGEVYVRATSEGAEEARDRLIRNNWHLVSCYREAPDEAPANPAEALKVWEEANHEHADPRVGVFSIASVTVAP